MKELQVENGGYTRIVNKVIEELIKIPFKGKELNVCLFIIRKTWGFQKKQDQISLTQIEKALDVSRHTVIKALKNLQLVNIVTLVKRGDSKKSANVYKFNKYFETWKLVKVAKLVQSKRSTSAVPCIQLVQTATHTKENNKRKTKKTTSSRRNIKFSKEDYNEIINSYENLKGVKFSGTEYLPIQQTIKSMFMDKRDKKDIIALMNTLNNSALEHWQGWTIQTVKKQLPLFLSGKLNF